MTKLKLGMGMEDKAGLAGDTWYMALERQGAPVTAFFSLSASHRSSAADLPAISSTQASKACLSACPAQNDPSCKQGDLASGAQQWDEECSLMSAAQRATCMALLSSTWRACAAHLHGGGALACKGALEQHLQAVGRAHDADQRRQLRLRHC